MSEQPAHASGNNVLCLIANPSHPVLSTGIVGRVQAETGGEINWLSRKTACEIIAPKTGNAAAIARDILGGLEVDVALVPQRHRRKKLLLADMDSTMINEECIDELADELDLKPEIAAITAKAMRGELDFARALATRVKLLAGLDLQTIKQVRRERITLAPGGRVLVHTMKEYGSYCALVSGGFTLFADYFAKRIGFDEATANALEFDENDRLTGRVVPPVVDSSTKVRRLEELRKKLGIQDQQTLAVGDGANDLAMLKEAGMGVALHAKPSVAAAAPFRIEHGDLSALLYLQGYNEEEFVR
ncbi:MAG TPA: phosphoserine phosphatase SerB [Devosia sp.]|nr:phosphoserine phosphatase SerB [Devosia sp.]